MCGGLEFERLRHQELLALKRQEEKPLSEFPGGWQLGEFGLVLLGHNTFFFFSPSTSLFFSLKMVCFGTQKLIQKTKKTMEGAGLARVRRWVALMHLMVVAFIGFLVVLDG